MIQWVFSIWSLAPLPFLNLARTSGSSQFTYCWSLAWRILSITLLAYEMNATGQSFAHSLALPFFGIEMIADLFQISFIKNILFFIKNIYYYKNNNLFLFGCAGSSGLWGHFSMAASWGYSLITVPWPVAAAASLVAQDGLYGTWASVAVAGGL